RKEQFLKCVADFSFSGEFDFGKCCHMLNGQNSDYVRNFPDRDSRAMWNEALEKLLVGLLHDRVIVQVGEVRFLWTNEGPKEDETQKEVRAQEIAALSLRYQFPDVYSFSNDDFFQRRDDLILRMQRVGAKQMERHAHGSKEEIRMVLPLKDRQILKSALK